MTTVVYNSSYSKNRFSTLSADGKSCVWWDSFLWKSTDSVDYTNSAVRTIRKGDFVHAYPFSLTLHESVPMAGTFALTSFEPTQKSVTAVCGEKSGRTREASIEIAYSVRNSGKLAQVAPNAVLEQRLRAMAETKALANLRQSVNNIPLLLAERRETLGLISKKSKQLLALVKARQTTDLNRWFTSRRSQRARLAKDISGEHLGFLFGVLPLVSELEGLVKQLTDEKALVITGRGRQAELTELNQPLSDGNIGAFGNPTSIPYQGVRKTTTKVSYRCSLRMNVTSASALKLRDNGFNPVATAYDLVPLSFLSDFVSNLGTFLRSYDPIIGLNLESACSTLWRERKETVEVTGRTRSERFSPVYGETAIRTTTTVGAGKGFTRSLYVERFPMTKLPTAELFLVNNLSLGKAATLVSLGIQRYLKPVRYALKQKDFRYKGPRPKWLPPIKYR